MGKSVWKDLFREIKRTFGENQLVVSGVGVAVDTFAGMMEERLSELITVTGHTKEDVILRLKDGVERQQLFRTLADMQDVVIEHFETYKPSLNDIFVAKVGEEE